MSAPPWMRQLLTNLAGAVGTTNTVDQECSQLTADFLSAGFSRAETADALGIPLSDVPVLLPTPIALQ